MKYSLRLSAIALLAGLCGSAMATTTSTLTSIGLTTGSIGNGATIARLISLSGASSASFKGTITGTSAIGDVFAFGLYDSGDHLVSTSTPASMAFVPSFKREVWTISYGNLAAGNYTLKLTAGPTGGGTYKIEGSYNAPVVTSTVPEPQGLALVLAGLGVVGFVLRRSNAHQG